MKLSTGLRFKSLRSTGATVELTEEDLNRLHDVLREILFDVADYCDAHGLRYYLSSGTLLGAKRSQGFIPWDDDVDIEMPRADWNRFAQGMADEYSEKYIIQIPGETPGYFLGLGRVRKRGTILRDQNDIAAPPEQAGIFIDIFIVEDAPRTHLGRLLHGMGSLALGFAASCRKFALFADAYRTMSANDPSTRRIFSIKIALGRLLSFRSADSWFRSWNRWNSRVNDRSSPLVVVPAAVWHYFGALWPRDHYEPSVEVSFEGRAMRGPFKADELLEYAYGQSYLTPANNGRQHAILEFNLGEAPEAASPV